jgi:DNA-binding beta-propeller fold protein YncE
VEDLVSPLGFAIAPDGTFFVAEAFAGQLTRVDRSGARTQLITPAEGQLTSGVAVRGDRVSYTLSLPPEFQDGPPTDTVLATITRDGASRRTVSILDHELATNPDAVNLYGVVEPGECQDAVDGLSDFLGPAAFPGPVESNPYAVAYDWDGARIVADAAGNSLLRVSARGTVTTVAVLPPIAQVLTEEFIGGTVAQINEALAAMGEPLLPDDALAACVGSAFQSNPVPTDIEIGPGGHYFVTALPGAPENPGSGAVFRVNRWTGKVTMVADGFNGAVDLAVRGRTLYVAEVFAGQVSRFRLDDPSSVRTTPVDCPTAVEVDRRGTVWVAEGGICGDGPPSPGRIAPLTS